MANGQERVVDAKRTVSFFYEKKRKEYLDNSQVSTFHLEPFGKFPMPERAFGLSGCTSQTAKSFDEISQCSIP